jgi:hypothetical protein
VPLHVVAGEPVPYPDVPGDVAVPPSVGRVRNRYPAPAPGR